MKELVKMFLLKKSGLKLSDIQNMSSPNSSAPKIPILPSQLTSSSDG
jgi:hypothetical protein